MTAYLDCRTLEEYQQAHHQTAASIPAKSLFYRMHELPPRNVPIHLIVDRANRQTAVSFLQERQYSLLSIIIWDEAYEETLKQQKKWASGTHSNRLWQPSPLVHDFIKHYSNKKGKGLDIACGAGRDTVYLAQQGWHMIGVDHHEEAIKRCTQLASINHVNVTTYPLNLETHKNELAQTVDANSLDLICVARYLHRPLFNTIKTLLKPEGIILYQTFMQGCELLGSPKNPKYLLKPNELKHVFSDFKLLRNEVIEVENGRTVSAFIAQKI